MAPLILRLNAMPGRIQQTVCVTAQHRQMLDQVLSVFRISPDLDLRVMKKNQGIFDVTTAVLTRLQRVLSVGRPDLVLVQGDTTTAMAAGLAAFYLQIPVAHVEAGLRTYDKYQPFPEEINRHVLGVLADYHFAPTENARVNLLGEGVPSERIWVTGNTVIDALLQVAARQKRKSQVEKWIAYFHAHWNLRLAAADTAEKIILVTGHRRENFGRGFESICRALREIVRRHPPCRIVYPLHLNPRVQEPVRRILGREPRVHLLPPLAYEPFVFLMSRAHLVLTDSGGIQEEAPSLGKPVLVMREVTERPEGVTAGTVRLVGTVQERIVSETLRLLSSRAAYERMARAVNPYGDGKATSRIVRVLCRL